jgi:nitrite reductase/ring-hydroxylating ferredoxin subunit
MSEFSKRRKERHFVCDHKGMGSVVQRIWRLRCSKHKARLNVDDGVDQDKPELSDNVGDKNTTIDDSPYSLVTE